MAKVTRGKSTRSSAAARKTGGETGQRAAGGSGLVVEFAPGERHAVLARTTARLLLLLTPWPGDGHPGTMPLSVNHLGQLPSVTVSFNLASGMALSDAVSTIDRVQAESMGLSVTDVYTAIQLMLAPVYANDFIYNGRVLRVLSSAGSEQLVAEARALQPVAVDVTPVTLKEIFLETVAVEI